MGFEQAHQAFMQGHLDARTGERQARLKRGHSHAELLFLQQVWWPLKGNFVALHPEYEVLDWRNRSYFADFAWLPGYAKLLIEIKGFAPHVRDMDRQKYCNELNRETFLAAMGYEVISFAYDDVEQRPELCQALLRMLLARYQLELSPLSGGTWEEKEIVRLAVQLARPIRPQDVKDYFQLDYRKVKRLLTALCEKGWLAPVRRGQGIRIVKYELAARALDILS